MITIPISGGVDEDNMQAIILFEARDFHKEPYANISIKIQSEVKWLLNIIRRHAINIPFLWPDPAVQTLFFF